MNQDAETAAAQRPGAAVVRGVIPYLSLDGRAAEAAEFYARAFGATDSGRFPDEGNPGRFMHIQVEINGGMLMMTDCVAPGEEPVAPRGMMLQLVVADGDAWWQRAVDAGCTELHPFQRMFWGDRWGMLRDPFGIDWAIDEPAA